MKSFSFFLVLAAACLSAVAAEPVAKPAEKLAPAVKPTVKSAKPAEAGTSAANPSAKKGVKPVRGSRRAPGAEPTRLTSDSLEFDYGAWIAMASGHVVVTDPEFALSCDRLIVFFENTNEVKTVKCVGNVDVASGDILARAGNATYTRADACLVLRENPVVRKGEQVLSGEVITVWLADQRVVVGGKVDLEAHPDTFRDTVGKDFGKKSVDKPARSEDN